MILIIKLRTERRIMVDNIKFGEMVSKYMKINNLTMKELGKKVGRGESTVSMWIAGKSTPPMGMVQKLADLFEVTTDTMIYGDCNSTDKIKNSNITFNEYFPLRYSTNLSAGSLDELLDAEPDAVVYVPKRFQAMKSHIYAFKVNGGSMNNKIADGSIVIVDSDINSNEVQEGSIVVAFIDGTVAVKRIYQKKNQITLMPDSSDKLYQPIVINTDITLVFIIGKVIWHMNPDDIFKIY